MRSLVEAANVVNSDPDRFERELAQSKQDAAVSQLKVATLLVGAFGMATTISAAELLVAADYKSTPAVFALKALSSAFTALLLVLVVLLYRAQLFSGKLRGELDGADTLFSTGAIRFLAVELILCAIHCPVGVDATVTLTNLGLTIRYTLDEVFSVIVVLRCYLLLRVFDDAAGFVTNQARVVAKWNRVNFGIGFTFRSMMERSPLLVVGALMFVTTLGLAHALRVFERPVCRDWAHIIQRCGPYHDSYDHFTTSLWNVIITMTTVGYGDIFPISHGGRLVATIACFAGVALVALLVTAITGMSKFEPDELRAFNALYRSQGRSSHRQAAVRMISACWKYYKRRLRTIYGLDTKLRFPSRRRMRPPTAASLEKDVEYVTNIDGSKARIPNGYRLLLAEIHIWKKARKAYHEVTRERSELALVVAEVLQSRARLHDMSQALGRQTAMISAIVPNLKAQLDLVSAKLGVPRLPLPSTVIIDPGLTPGAIKYPAKLVYSPSPSAAFATAWPKPGAQRAEVYPMAYIDMHEAVASDADKEFADTLRSLPSMHGSFLAGQGPRPRVAQPADSALEEEPAEEPSVESDSEASLRSDDESAEGFGEVDTALPMAAALAASQPGPAETRADSVGTNERAVP